MDRFQELSKIALDELSEVQSVFFCLVQEEKGFRRESLLCA